MNLKGDANDYVGKGLSGGSVSIKLQDESNLISNENTIIGNTVLYGAGTGAASSILGIGGGSFTVPYLNYAGLRMVDSIGTASACGVIISIFASFGFILSGLGEDQALEKSIGFIYWPALVGISLGSLFSVQTGVYLAHKMNEKLLKILFSIFILLVSYYMLFI